MKKNYIIEGYQLDNNQIELLKNDTNALVIAGAGSGKTLTIIGKVNYLIEERHINPNNILLLSFTNTSVNDIKKRIKYNVNIFTFHKLAMYILEKNDINFSICNQTLLNYIIKEYLKTISETKQKNILKFLKLNTTYNLFIKSQNFDSFCNIIETFINIYKTNGLNINDILLKHYTKKEKRILIIIFEIYKLYLEEKASTKKFDFDDLIIEATLNVKNIKFNFKYIIIDEFQDTSLIRLNLIKEIHMHEKSKIIVVGDDWQSIYQFSGCDLNIFLNFSKIFKNVSEIKLVNTYRNSQELIDIATKFVQKNPYQIKKKLVSKKRCLNPIIFAPYNYAPLCFKKILDYLLLKSNDIMVLSRNNNDIYNYLDKDISYNDNFIIYKNKNIKYLTIHKSKGLEAEYVLILNCNNSYLGFPNQIANNKLINNLIKKEKIPFSEERRLFYVAITRCKKQTYILYDKNKPSIFVKEIKKIVKSITKVISYFK